MLVVNSTGVVKYADYFSAEELDPHPNDCPRYDTKTSDGKAPVTQNDSSC